MIFFEDKDGLCCRPLSEIATVTPAFPDRLRIDCTDGCVGYCFDATDQALNDPLPYSDAHTFDRAQPQKGANQKDVLAVKERNLRCQTLSQ